MKRVFRKMLSVFTETTEVLTEMIKVFRKTAEVFTGTRKVFRETVYGNTFLSKTQ
jgi:hypothetical protein